MHKYPDTIRIPRIVVCFLRIEYSSSIYAKYPDTVVSLGNTAEEHYHDEQALFRALLLGVCAAFDRSDLNRSAIYYSTYKYRQTYSLDLASTSPSFSLKTRSMIVMPSASLFSCSLGATTWTLSTLST